MIKLVEQESFKRRRFSSSGLNLHAHPGRGKGKVVLFVHGFCGQGYNTWSNMPMMLFSGEMGPPVDVAVYDYPSGIRALLRRGADLSFYASQLASGLDELSEKYDEIYVAAHSLGGLLSQAAIRLHLDNLKGSSLTSLAAIFFFASPRAGAWLASIPLFRESDWLRPFSKQVAANDSFFSTFIESRTAAPVDPQFRFIPMYACMAEADQVVASFSSGLGIPERQRLRIRGSHTSVAKPTVEDSSQVAWVLEGIRQVSDKRQQWIRELEAMVRRHQVGPATPAPFIVGRLLTDPRGFPYERVYTDVRRLISTANFSVYDHRDYPEAPINVLIAVHDDHVFLQESERAKDTLRQAYQLQQNEAVQPLVIIAPVGLNFREALSRAEEWLPRASSSYFYLEGVEDIEALREAMPGWFQLVIDRDPRRQDPSQRVGRLLGGGQSAYDDLRRDGYL
ncbi:alpha/beta hydrolase [Streptomyces cellulosae]